MPEGLLESELFGHTKGAFSGAQMARRGLFLEASRGTIFLDEIGEMPEGMQAKLLRVLEQRQIRPVGSDREVGIDVRVLAATNQDLDAAVRQGTFREDLYYRLNVMRVQVPPLRDHPEDIPFLAETFLQRHVATNQLGHATLYPRGAALSGAVCMAGQCPAVVARHRTCCDLERGGVDRRARTWAWQNCRCLRHVPSAQRGLPGATSPGCHQQSSSTWTR